jgi:AcrR family transcriptional regulator
MIWLRSEEKMVKKQLIMEKSLELFATKGFESTSVQQITEHCGISKGAFYLSFKSKDELILALIDHFMMQIISDIDYIVINERNEEKLLFEFYKTMFSTFHKHSDFAKIFIKEQMQSFNEEFILKMHYYDSLIEKSVLSMIQRLYGDMIQQTKYDLIYCVKGFMHTYSQLLCFYNVPLDINLLSQSLVEKTNLLASHITIPFISQELFQQINIRGKEVTEEDILEIMDQKIEEVTDSVEKESLMLLKQQLIEPTLSPAIVKGLLENIRNNPHCKWISYLLRHYFKI